MGNLGEQPTINTETSARKSVFVLSVPSAIGAILMGVIWFWGLFLPDPTSGPTGKALGTFFGLIASPVVIAIGFGLGWSMATLKRMISHKIEWRRTFAAIAVLVICAYCAHGIVRTNIFHYWATSPSATKHELQMVYNDAIRTGKTGRLTTLCINPALSAELIDLLVKRNDLDLNRWLARNPALPADTIRTLSTDKHSSVLYALIHNPATPPDILRDLSNHKKLGTEALRVLEARNPNGTAP